MEGKSTKVGKLYGNPHFATGPARGAGTASIPEGNGSKGNFATGPARGTGDQAINKGSVGKGSMGGGTKADQKGEDSGGKA